MKAGQPLDDLPFTLHLETIRVTTSVTPSCLVQGPLAQSVEQRTFNPWVVGSIPTGPTLIF